MKKNNRKVITKEILNKRLLEASQMNEGMLFQETNTSRNGLDEAMVEVMRERFGNNEITYGKKDSLLKKCMNAFIDPFTIVLLVLAAISAGTDIIFVTAENRDITAVVIVLTMVFISGSLKFVQELRSGNAAEKLEAMVNITTAVERQGKGRIEIPLSEIVRGDIVHLAAGDMIPADIRILSAKDLFISQSALTGESEGIEKLPYRDEKIQYKDPIEIPNLAFMGTNVISGTAVGVVIATGNETMFGSIAQSITTTKVVTSFEKGVNSVSWLLIRFMMIMSPIVLFVNGFTKGDWMEAFLFALSVAVGLTPEMLPMIVTTNLAKGTVRMAKKKTVVKNLNSIQNFGAMDVLCTDKTGTLTQDKVILERHLNIHGKRDERVLRHAFFNSYYQTGLKNLIDVAILDHGSKTGFQSLTNEYTKVDEIPFDFNRRRMSVVIKDLNGKTQLITKGAVEEMLSISSYVEYNGYVEELTATIKNEIIKTVESLNSKGMRVIAIAQKTNPSVEGIFSVQDESEMVLMGYLAFLDPPKETTAATIQALKEYGVEVKVLTGDNEVVTKSICHQVGMSVDKLLLGTDIEKFDEQELEKAVEETNIFAKLSPQQKVRIVDALRKNGHTVGFLGDGINDAAAMKESDVGISVDTAVDIAKESADIILLEKDLMVLEEGIIEGRKTFGNIIKYIKMTASSNFGNMFSVLAASAFLPFLPMLPLQILVLNLIYDISCISIPWDNIDEEYLKKPRKWDSSSIGKFMVWFGPTSSVFDIITYWLLFFVICPAILGGHYGSVSINNTTFVALFNAGWFVESLWTQTLVIHLIRTPKIPFIQSRASWSVTLVTAFALLVGTIIPYTSFGLELKMYPISALYYAWLFAIILGYMILVALIKKIYIQKYGELL